MESSHSNHIHEGNVDLRSADHSTKKDHHFGSKDVEFVVAGHSNISAMGAPKGYKGPGGLVPTEAFGRKGFFFLGVDAALPDTNYWRSLINSSENRDIVIVWGGNQHLAHFLFESDVKFDFYDDDGPPMQNFEVVYVPKDLIRTYFEPTVSPLKEIIAKLIEVGAHSVTVIGTPPPQSNLSEYEMMIRSAPAWRKVAEKCGVDLQAASFMPSRILLKLWGVIQELLKDAADAERAENVRFVPVSETVLDENGFLAPQFRLPTDFTHANDEYGKIMLKAGLSSN